VTGASGFIGSHLVARLCRDGAEVHAVSRAAKESRHGETWHVADLGDPDSTAELVRETAPEVIHHLASNVTGARGVEFVRPMLDSTLRAAVNLMTAAAAAPGTRVVLAGSVEEPREGEPTPSSPYAVAKWAATGYARMFHQLWDVPVTVLRVAMVYGPGRQDTKKLVPYVALSLLRGEEPGISSGTRLIDWVYVDDVVEAFVSAGEGKAAGQVLDIGSGHQVSIQDTVELLVQATGSGLRPRYGVVADRPLDRPQVSDVAPAARVLGWSPVTPLAEGLRRTVDWFADPCNRTW
jgi:nucleoside-diphosphate-sugar epimerase